MLRDRGPRASATTPFAAGQTGYLNTMTGSQEGLLHRQVFIGLFRELLPLGPAIPSITGKTAACASR